MIVLEKLLSGLILKFLFGLSGETATHTVEAFSRDRAFHRW
jgi:hypothetical protein